SHKPGSCWIERFDSPPQAELPVLRGWERPTRKRPRHSIRVARFFCFPRGRTRKLFESRREGPARHVVNHWNAQGCCQPPCLGLGCTWPVYSFRRLPHSGTPFHAQAPIETGLPLLAGYSRPTYPRNLDGLPVRGRVAAATISGAGTCPTPFARDPHECRRVDPVCCFPRGYTRRDFCLEDST